MQTGTTPGYSDTVPASAKTAPTKRAPSGRNGRPLVCWEGSLIKSSSFSSSSSSIKFEDEDENEDEQERLGSKLIKHPRIGLHQAHQILRFEHAQRAEVRPGFGEPIQFVRAGNRRVQQYRLRVPGMAFQRARRRMVAGNHEHVRLFPQQ